VARDEADEAFDRGDWGKARDLARAQLDDPDDATRSAARVTLDRLRPDRQLGVLYGVMWALLAFVLLTVR
jgi:hypothetical protein